MRLSLIVFLFSLLCCIGLLHAQHLMGPTGLTGQTGKSDIKITKVDKGSPGDGKLKPGDIIIGLNGEKFEGNPRRDLARAIDEAEGSANNGRLVLTLKGGMTVDIQLKPYGKFSNTAPFNCKKTDALVKAIAEKMVADEKGIANDRLPVGHLGLMATGEQKNIDFVRASLAKQSWAKPDREACMAVMEGGSDMGYVGWYWGYALTALAEYQLLTGDKTYMPGIETYALALAKGQCQSGTWGHRMISSKRRGRLPGYSHINQPSLVCFIGMSLAKACGVDDPKLQAAIERSSGFFKTFVGKGTIPYGVHNPNSRDFNNNGMSGSAALAMALVGDKKASKFFSSQVAADSDRLETGHASYFFNVLWSPLGTNVAGPEVTQEYHKRSRWLYTLYRSWDDKFTYNGSGHKSINTNGALLLNYCIPRKALYITGKNADESIWFRGEQAIAVLDQSKIDYASKTEAELVAMFSHPAPQIRRRAQWTLRDRQGKGLELIDLQLKSDNVLAKQCAIDFYGYKCPPEWAEPRINAIGEIIRQPKQPLSVRTSAANTLCWHQPYAKKYYQDMLKLVLENKEDNYGLINEGIANALTITSSDPYADGLIKDKKLFYEAVRILAHNPRQGARGSAMKLINKIPAEDFPLVADEVKLVAMNDDPKAHSYHNPGATLQPAGQILARLGIREGLDWAMGTMDTEDGKGSFKIRAVQAVLLAYGAHAKDAIKIIEADEGMMRGFAGGRFAGGWKKMLQAVEQNQKPTRKLISFEEAKQGKVAK